MGYFANKEIFEEVLVGFFNQMADSEMAPKLLQSGLVIRFNYTDPNLIVVVDCSGSRIEVRPHDTTCKAEVEMSMNADIAHKFWFGKVNLTKALTRKEMIAKGPIPKVLKLLPAIKPAYTMYPEWLDKNGYSQYNILKA